MKTNILTILLYIFLIGCAKSNSPSAGTQLAPDHPVQTHSCETLSYQGTWYNSQDTSQTLEISSQCTATGSYCNHLMSFTLPDELSGETILSVHNANLNGGCMQPEDFSCTFIESNDLLYIDCETTNQYIYQRSD